MVLFERITSNIHAIYTAGWRPPRAYDDPIMWQGREENVVADFLANLTMDKKESWQQVCDWPFPSHKIQDCSFVVHSDGEDALGQLSLWQSVF